MFDGKMLRAATGTPILSTAFANSPFADADPEPLTLANLTTKSLTLEIGFICASVPARPPEGHCAPPRGAASEASVGVVHPPARPPEGHCAPPRGAASE